MTKSRTTLVQLFTISDAEVKPKIQVDCIPGEYRAVVVDKKDPNSTIFGWGSETSHATFIPLHYGSTVKIVYKDKMNLVVIVI